MSKMRKNIYPSTSPMGGVLIRKAIQLLRQGGIKLPIDLDILIAISGGSDSMALAHLLIHYGRKIVSPKQIALLHINHRWRGQKSDQDEHFLREIAEAWKVPIHISRLPRPTKKSMQGKSWEAVARHQRKEIYQRWAEKESFIFTAHQADDLSETVLWRLFTGTARTHGGGILIRHKNEIRPFLRIRKNQLQQYLQEHQVPWRVDETNFEGRFLRSKMRLELMPVVEKIFPRAIDHLLEMAFEQQELC